jgi:hypothetical protein
MTAEYKAKSEAKYLFRIKKNLSKLRQVFFLNNFFITLIYVYACWSLH